MIKNIIIFVLLVGLLLLIAERQKGFEQCQGLDVVVENMPVRSN